MAMDLSRTTEIVVPLDGRAAGLRALPVAERLTSRLSLGLRLFAAGVADSEHILDWMAAQARDLLNRIDFEMTTVAAHDPVSSIIEAASPSGLVCMATAGSLLPHQGHVGSVAEGVVRQGGRPVFLVGPRMTAEPGAHTSKIVVPVDGSERSEAVIELAADLANRLDVPMWVVSAVPAGAENRVHALLGGSGQTGEAGYVRRLAAEAGERYDIRTEFEVLHIDDPAEAIVDFAGDDGTVVMSTHGRSGLNRVFGGSVASGVVSRSRRAVLVWRPH